MGQVLPRLCCLKGYDGINVDVEFNDNPVAVLEDDFINYLISLIKYGSPC
jgi:hypothetical protein